jgi:hypothetical protein
MDMIKESRNESTNRPIKKLRSKKTSTLNAVLGGLLVLSLITGGFFYNKYRSLSTDPKKAVESRNASETKDVLDAVSKILLTESDKQPTVARVETPDALKGSNPDFYKNITAGDYLILYPQRAIVFRKSENKIINVAPIVDTSKLDPATGTTPAKN